MALFSDSKRLYSFGFFLIDLHRDTSALFFCSGSTGLTPAVDDVIALKPKRLWLKTLEREKKNLVPFVLKCQFREEKSSPNNL